MIGTVSTVKPEEGKKSSKIKIYCVYSKVEYELPHEMTREELVDKILKDTDFRKQMKEDLDEREYKLVLSVL